MRKLMVLTLCLIVAASVAAADAPKKPLSPATRAVATLNGKAVTIDYSAPSRRQRKIIGELVPFGKVWRTGANAATTLKTDTDLMVGTLHVPAGTYTLFTIPGEKEWTLIVNKQTGQWGTNYDQAQDLGRVKMTVAAVKETVETFAIGLKSPSPKKATLFLTWENTAATVPVTVH